MKKAFIITAACAACVLPAFSQAAEQVLPETVRFADFPNKHPLVVHFPIVLLIAAVVVQFVLLFRPHDITLKWVTFSLLLAGFIGAFLAVNVFNAHISGDAPDPIFNTYETHHHFAMLTLWTSLGATVLRFIANIWVRKKWAEFIVLAAVIASGVFVSITGHYGSGLPYIYGAGPKGHYILEK